MQGKLLQFKSKSPVARREKAESRRQEGQRQVEDSNPSTKVDLASFSGDLALATPVLSVFIVFLFFSFSLRIAFTSSGSTQANSIATLLTMATEANVFMCLSTKS